MKTDRYSSDGAGVKNRDYQKDKSFFLEKVRGHLDPSVASVFLPQICFCLALICLTTLTRNTPAADTSTYSLPAPKSPRESLAAIQTRPGFKTELVASEPLLESPVAFDWGADGKLWVVEMVDYPLGMDGQGKPGGRVRFLEDTKGNGHYDKSTIFLDGLNFPNGIIPWRKGVIVSAPPEIFYAEDTDGDGKADIHVTLFTGFREGNQQHRANGFDYGLDNWIYGANGESGGTVHSAITGKDFDISGRDFRFRPDTGEFETQSGQTQFGRHRDDWGDWFGNNNAEGSWHYFIPEQYIARNPESAPRDTKQVMPDYPDYTRIYPVSRVMQRFDSNEDVNHLTSANSTSPYRDDLFGPDFATSYFVSDPAYNLIHREILEPDGVSFSSHRAADETIREFLASGDNWFRPTMTKTGPDGALYICDMYRMVIEHPEWIPPDFQSNVNLRAGSNLGRIYRVFPKGKTLRKIPRFDKLSPVQLAAALENPNGWQRDTVQRLLVESGDKSATDTLKKLATQSPNAKTRLQALCTLDGLHSLDIATLLTALKDSAPAIRENALRLSEPLLDASPELADAVLALASDPSLRVRYQLAFSLGEWHNPLAGRALGGLAAAHAGNERMQIAIFSSAAPHLGEMISTLLETAAAPGHADLLRQCVEFAVRSGDAFALGKALSAITTPGKTGIESWRFMALAGFLDGLNRRGTSLADFESNSPPAMKATPANFEPVFTESRAIATNPAASAIDRVAAIGLLGRDTLARDADFDLLTALADPRNPPTIQQAVTVNLIHNQAPNAGNALVTVWRKGGPEIREQTMNALLNRDELTQSLLAALESKTIPLSAINQVQRDRLLQHQSGGIGERATKLFQAADADREEVLRRYATVTGLKGNPAKGAEYFRKNCTVCHRLRNEGNSVGPDLGSVSAKPVDYLLTAILDPNRSVETRYTQYTVTTKNGTEYIGIITTETANSLTLRQPGGMDVVVSRNELKEMTGGSRSLMPEGFENGLPPQALADLIAYIRAAR